MNRKLTVVTLLVTLVFAGAARAQEEAHFEGYNRVTSPTYAGQAVSGFGLVTALYAPLISSFTANEYTYAMTGLVSLGSTLRDSVYTTQYSVAGSRFAMYEDPAGDARAAFYNCPNGNPQAVYTSGTPYLVGHFTSFRTTLDMHAQSSGQGTFTAEVNWDSGSHLNDLPPGRRGAWSFGGSTQSSHACIPAGYAEAVTGRIFQFTTPAARSTWGQVRNLYR